MHTPAFQQNDKNLDFRDMFSSTSSNSDKISHHGYQRIYPWFLHHLVDKNPVLLEIGFDKGDSIPLWKEYFKNPVIHICDINPSISSEEEFVFHPLDQSKINDWENFRNNNPTLKFDLIVDDGSHVPEHQMLSLNNIWPMLNEGGIYIIEDIETSYWNNSSVYGYNFSSQKSSVFKSLISVIDIINDKISSIPKSFSPISKKTFSSNFKFGTDVEMIAFGYNSIVLIKKEEKYREYYEKEYRIPAKINENAKNETLIMKIKRLINS